MIREIVNIDETKCDGCALCVPNCHEGAIQIIDGKARLISELMCDGLGNCLGHCPHNAISIEKREAEDYDEILVMEKMISKGKNTIIAHLKHLKDHNEAIYLKQAVSFLKNNRDMIHLDVDAIINEVHAHGQEKKAECGGGGSCPGSAPRTINRNSFVKMAPTTTKIGRASELQQWPIQLHLINPNNAAFRNSDLLVAADCTAFAYGEFQTILAGKKLAIACPKLDQNQERYAETLISLIDNLQVNTITVAIMEVPCCSGLSRMVQMVAQRASRKVPIKLLVIGISGELQREEWL